MRRIVEIVELGRNKEMRLRVGAGWGSLIMERNFVTGWIEGEDDAERKSTEKGMRMKLRQFWTQDFPDTLSFPARRYPRSRNHYIFI